MILIINLSDINIYVYCFFKLNFMRFSWSYSLHYFNAVIMLLCLAIFFKIQTYFCSSSSFEYKHCMLYIWLRTLKYTGTTCQTLISEFLATTATP